MISQRGTEEKSSTSIYPFKQRCRWKGLAGDSEVAKRPWWKSMAVSLNKSNLFYFKIHLVLVNITDTVRFQVLFSFLRNLDDPLPNAPYKHMN